MKSLKKEMAELLALVQHLFKEKDLPCDFSIESLQSISKILKESNTANEDSNGQVPLDRKLLALGIYLGKTVIKHVNESTWDQEIKNVKDMSITFMSGSKIWPVRRVINCWKNGFVNGDIFKYTSEIIAEENRKVALRKKKKQPKAWWQFWK